MTKQLRLPQRQCLVAISELSHEITSPQQAQALLLPSSAYQLIPGYLESAVYQPDNIIRWLLPHSSSRLIDITQPYYCPQQSTKILARYILFDRKLIGIRLAPSKQSSLELNKWVSPPPVLQSYYKEGKIDFNINQVFVGDFYLQFRNCRIGLFFQSELANFTAFRDIYARYRFDIISIVSNNQRKLGKDEHGFIASLEHKDLQQNLALLSRQCKVTIMFAGLKIVPSLSTVYWEKSIIRQDNNVVSFPKNLIGEKNYAAFIANIELSLQSKWTQKKFQAEDSMEQEPSYIQKLQISGNLHSSVSVAPSVPTNLQNKRLPTEFIGQKQLKMYNLWYLFKTVNKNSPFVIPFPFSEKRQQLVSYLIALNQHSSKDLNDLVKIYRYKIDNSVSKYHLKIYENFPQMIQQCERQFLDLIYVYCQDAEQLKRLKSSSQYGFRVCNCQSLIPISTKEGVEVVPNDVILSKKLENACLHVLKQRFQSIQQILAYFWDIQLSKKEIEKCFSQIIPNKVKKYFKLTPHYLFFLQSTPEQIVNELGQAQIRLKSTGKSRFMLDEIDWNKNTEQTLPKVVQRIQAAKRYKNNANLQPKCHKCQFRMKKDLVYNCKVCSTSLCYQCIDVLTRHSLFELNKYKCAICLGLCKCDKCVKITKPAKPTAPAEVKNKVELSLFSEKSHLCTGCEILNADYNRIQIQCSQCKKSKCYNCAKYDKKIDKSKMKEWKCKDCEAFNKEISLRERNDEIIITFNDDNDMNEEILEESVSRSASPPKVLPLKESFAEKAAVTLVQREQSLLQREGKKVNQVSNFKNSGVNQLQENKMVDQRKNDRQDKQRKVEQGKKVDQSKRSKGSGSRSNSSERSRSRRKSKQKNERKRDSSSSSSVRSRRKQGKSKPLWNNHHNKQKKPQNKHSFHTQKTKKRDKEKKGPKKEVAASVSRQTSPLNSNLIFAVNNNRKINDLQQQSY